jgi:CheY-like chemotaxis protein
VHPRLDDGFIVADTPAATSQTPAPTNPSVRVLIVDDNEAIRWLVGRILDEAKGYTVVTACDPAAALRASDSAMTDDRRTIHLVLTDLDIPGGGGWALGRQHCRKPGPRVPRYRSAVTSKERSEVCSGGARKPGRQLRPVGVRRGRGVCFSLPHLAPRPAASYRCASHAYSYEQRRSTRSSSRPPG